MQFQIDTEKHRTYVRWIRLSAHPPLTPIYGVADAVKRNGTVKQTSPDLEKVWRGLLFLALNHASLV